MTCHLLSIILVRDLGDLDQRQLSTRIGPLATNGLVFSLLISF